MKTSTAVQRTPSSQSTKNAKQTTGSTSPKPLKSTYGILRDAGFRSMNDFMFSHGLKLHNDEHLAQAKEMIERMKEEELRGEDPRRLEFRGGSDEENVEDNRGVESSEEEDGAVESIGFAEVIIFEEVEDGVQVRGVEMGEETGMVSPGEEGSGENVDVGNDGGVMSDDNYCEDFGYDYIDGGDNDGYDVYDDQDDYEDDYEDDFEDDFEEDFFYDS